MEAATPMRRPGPRLLAMLIAVVALLATTVGTAEAQRDRSDRARPDVARDVRPDVVRDVRPDVRPDRVERLRLECHPDSIDGQRGVLCRWSEATNPNTRGYQLYKSTNGGARELVTTVGVDGRTGFFDTQVTAPSNLLYAVISLNRNGHVIGRSAPVRVQFGQDIAQLRMACHPDSINGHRGVLCRWSESDNTNVRGYLVYRILGDQPREVIARIGLDGRRAHFDREVVPGALHTYGVTAVDANGKVLAIGGPQRVQWPAGD